MSATCSRYSAYSVTTIFVLASIAVACSLNPQPIPPGDQPDGSAGGGSINPTFGDADGATKLTDEAGPPMDGGIDAPVTPPPQDAGSDASDASSDANDASDDAAD